MNCFLKLIGDTSGGLTSDLKQASMNGAEYNYIYTYVHMYIGGTIKHGPVMPCVNLDDLRSNIERGPQHPWWLTPSSVA